jgi:hypothetical protein
MAIEIKNKPDNSIITEKISSDYLDLGQESFDPSGEFSDSTPVTLPREVIAEKALGLRGALEDELMEILELNNPVLDSIREKELRDIESYITRPDSVFADQDPVEYLYAHSGGVYLSVESSSVQQGEHQAVVRVGSDLILKTKLAGQDLEKQTSEGSTFIRLGAERYKWENLTAESALPEIGVDVPIASTYYFNIKWQAFEDEKFPVILPLEHPGSTFTHTRETSKVVPNIALTQDLSQGGKYEVREYFDSQNEELTNYEILKSKVDESVATILQYCQVDCDEKGVEKKPGYEASFSLHAHSKAGYSVYESEARSLFFVLVDRQEPTTGILVIGDLDGLSLKKSV